VKSKSAGVSYKLDKGPEGMTVSAAGEVRWDVPPGQAGKTVPPTARRCDRPSRRATAQPTMPHNKPTALTMNPSGLSQEKKKPNKPSANDVAPQPLKSRVGLVGVWYEELAMMHSSQCG